MNFIEKTVLFNEIAGNNITYNARMLSLYVGLLLEEVEEVVSAFDNERNDAQLLKLSELLKSVGTDFKKGEYDHMADGSNEIELTDGFIDCGVIGVGGVMANGFSPLEAFNHVADSNLSKYDDGNNGYLVLKDENGKIKKGERYFKPSLEQFRSNDRSKRETL